MQLVSARVYRFRNVVDSNPVPIDESITCLIGKNESGKTAFLDALYSLNPVHPNTVRVKVVEDYPRWRMVRDRDEGSLEKVNLVRAKFLPNDAEREKLGNLLSYPIPDDVLLIVSRTYDGTVTFQVDVDDEAVTQLFLRSAPETVSGIDAVAAAESLAELADAVAGSEVLSDRRTKEAQEAQSYLDKIKQAEVALSNPIPDDKAALLKSHLPTFFYFGEYSTLPGRIDLKELLAKEPDNRSSSDQTAMSLLRLVGVTGKEFIESDFENRVAELEAAASEVTHQVLEYWSQNQDIRVDLKSDSVTRKNQSGETVVHKYLDIRMLDERHKMTTNFRARSTGFQWFFSFIVGFSQYRSDDNVVILLDEPGLGLHARAQADLLRYIETELAPTNQVIYTTHSPFMVKSTRLDQARLVEDLTSKSQPDLGAKFSTDVLSVGSDTLFPLQAALGYDMAQNLFVAGENLLVEGPSDFIYLSVMSTLLEREDLTPLDPRFTIVPVGGADKVPTFVALLGAHLAGVKVLIDGNPDQDQRLQDMVEKGILEGSNLFGVAQVVPLTNANVEDLFSPGDYLKLYNAAFDASIKVAELEGTDSILQQIGRVIDGKFDHLLPAVQLMGNQATLLGGLSDKSKSQFGELFEKLNSSLPPDGD